MCFNQDGVISIFNEKLLKLTDQFTSGDLCSIPGRVIPLTLKIVLDTFLLNTQQYKVRIKGKLEQSRERSSAFPDASVS